MKSLLKTAALLVILSAFSACKPKPHDRLANASREDKNGWIYIHLEGSPSHASLLLND